MLESTFREEYLKVVKQLVEEVRQLRLSLQEKPKVKRVKKCREAATK
jgi:hypothetical protein